MANLVLRLWPRNRPLLPVLAQNARPDTPRPSVKGVSPLPLEQRPWRPGTHLLPNLGHEVGTTDLGRSRSRHLKAFARTWPTSCSDFGHEIAPSSLFWRKKPHSLNPRLSVKGVELLPFGRCLGRPANLLLRHSGAEVGTIHQERPRLMYLKLFVRTWPTSVSDFGHEIAPSSLF